MTSEFHIRNRTNLMNALPDGALVVLFSGYAPRKRADEDYPFFADRNF
ncbi:MAG: aminopeptidase P N-terminal domain-containing protein, partial [Clostridia bacterium]|nr:aminopeptidase P N-terminal domain-containing protein [Clostridia bacterium]